MTICAIVVARGGSVRLPGKALLPFAGTTLIGHKLRTLRRCRLVGRIAVNTDCPKIAAEVRANDGERATVLLEGKDYANDTRRMIADSVRQVEADLIVWAHPTNPLVKAETYDAAIEAYRQALNHGHDSLCSVTAIQRHAWRQAFRHQFKPVNFDPWAERHPLASELPTLFFQDGAIFIQPRQQMLANRNFIGRNPLLFAIDQYEGLDVDTESDYRRALMMQSFSAALTQ